MEGGGGGRISGGAYNRTKKKLHSSADINTFIIYSLF